ncbi:MAG TPA: vanadium-dependent haloperoxidase [Ferruginibacter sp.]|nr:vanadium-dependent haloperoxidase [Ferruginibacter sp.]
MKKKIGLLLLLASLIIFNESCKKDIKETPGMQEAALSVNSNSLNGHLKQTKTFSSDVIVRWINMQLDMLRVPLPAGTGTQATDRAQAYSGIAVYEAVVPGMPAYQSLSGQLTDFPEMPSTEPGKAYHWAASANAALAEMSRRLFPTTAEVNKTAINTLENNLKAGYSGEVDVATLQRSIAFGKEVATRVANWAATDGSAIVNAPYVFPVGTGLPPGGTGLWVPTSPPPAAIVNPFAWQQRLIVPGSSAGTALAPPPPFSSNPGSAFYAMVKEVYDASLVLTTDQKAMADYFKDNPGYGAGGGFVWVLQEALKIAHPTLDQAAITYAKVGMAQHDVTIVLFTNKYTFNVIRPVTYIKAYINSAWNTYIPTPNHPEFPSGHATTNGAVLTMLSNSFGENFPITLHTYDYLGYAPRPYNTFTAMGTDMADSRIYGGLHYRETQEKSLIQGKKVAQNILDKVKFLKE